MRAQIKTLKIFKTAHPAQSYEHLKWARCAPFSFPISPLHYVLLLQAFIKGALKISNFARNRYFSGNRLERIKPITVIAWNTKWSSFSLKNIALAWKFDAKIEAAFVFTKIGFRTCSTKLDLFKNCTKLYSSSIVTHCFYNANFVTRIYNEKVSWWREQLW